MMRRRHGTPDTDDTDAGSGEGRGRQRRHMFGWGRRQCRDTDAPTLSDVAPGTGCTIRRLHGHGPARQRLLDLGFQPGRIVQVLRNAPLNDPVEVQLGDTFIALRRHEARHVEVTQGGRDD